MRVRITIDRFQGEETVIKDRIEVPIGAVLIDTLYKEDGTYEEIRTIAQEVYDKLCLGCAYAEINGNTCSHLRCSAIKRKDEKEIILSKFPM